MIKVTKIDGSKVIVNSDEIETVESAYDTTITFNSGKKVIVRENYEEIVKKTIEYKQACFSKILVDPGIKQKESE